MRRNVVVNVARAYDLGIDLGSANTVIATANDGVVFDEPTCVVVGGGSRLNTPFGHEAAQAAARGSAPGKVIYPLSRGRLIDADALHDFLGRALSVVGGKGKRCDSASVAVSSLLSPRDLGLIARIFAELKVTKVHFVKDILTGAAGCPRERDVDAPVAVVDVGAEVVSWGIVRHGEVLCHDALEIGGRDFNQDVMGLLQRRYRMQLSESQAAAIIATLGCRGYDEPGITARVAGKQLTTGVPAAHMISAGDVTDAIGGRTEDLCLRLKRFFDALPEDVLKNLLDHGVDLCGGSAMMPGLASRMAEKIGLPVEVSSNPMHANAIGAARTLVLHA